MDSPATVLTSEIPPETLDAYRATHFRVLCVDRKPFVLRIDEPSEPLRALQEEKNCACSAFITAWNPLGDLKSNETNERTQRELIVEIDRRNLSWIQGEGTDPSGQWPGEPSLLVLGLSFDDTKALGLRFKQNAVLWMGEDAIPRLILMR